MLDTFLKYTKVIGGFVLLVTFIGYGYSWSGQIKANTKHRLMQRYKELQTWIKDDINECGEDTNRVLSRFCQSQRRYDMRQNWDAEIRDIENILWPKK